MHEFMWKLGEANNFWTLLGGGGANYFRPSLGASKFYASCKATCPTPTITGWSFIFCSALSFTSGWGGKAHRNQVHVAT